MVYKARAYKIFNIDDDKIYVGCTKQTLSRRLSAHKRDCSNKSTGMILHEHMRKLGAYKFHIELLEEKEVENRQQQYILESQWQKKLQPPLNKVIAYITDEERQLKKKYYKETHKREISITSKKYREKNKEKQKSYMKEYEIKNKESLHKYRKEYTQKSKNRKAIYDKQYRETNKKKQENRKKKWREENKRLKRFSCEQCQKYFGSASEMRTHNKNKHLK
jgi:arylsulfatase A-like enzyme